MRLRWYLILMSCGTLLAFGAWIRTMATVIPEEATAIEWGLFYLTLLLWVMGAFAIFGVLFRVLILKRNQFVIREVKTAFRHSLLLSSLAVITLALSRSVKFQWWIIFVLIGALLAIEYLALILEESRRG